MHTRTIDAFVFCAFTTLSQGQGAQGPSNQARAADEWIPIAQAAVSLRAPLGPNESEVARVTTIRALDAKAAEFGHDGWMARQLCAEALFAFAAEPASRKGLVQIRDDAEAEFERGHSPTGTADAWIVAKRGLGEVADVMTWIELRCNDQAPVSKRYPATAIALRAAVVEAARYDLLRCIVDDTARVAFDAIELLEREKAAMREDPAGKGAFENYETLEAAWITAAFFAIRIDEAASFHASLLVEGRADEAFAVADRLLKFDTTNESRLRMAMHAARAGVAGPRHAEWLNETINSTLGNLKSVQDDTVARLRKGGDLPRQVGSEPVLDNATPPF